MIIHFYDITTGTLKRRSRCYINTPNQTYIQGLHRQVALYAVVEYYHCFGTDNT